MTTWQSFSPFIYLFILYMYMFVIILSWNTSIHKEKKLHCVPLNEIKAWLFLYLPFQLALWSLAVNLPVVSDFFCAWKTGERTGNRYKGEEKRNKKDSNQEKGRNINEEANEKRQWHEQAGLRRIKQEESRKMSCESAVPNLKGRNFLKSAVISYHKLAGSHVWCW